MAVTPAPQWLIQARGYYAPKTDTTEPPKIDEGGAVTRALSYLAHDAPQAVEGSGGDSTTYQVAARLKDFGVTVNTAYLLLSTAWNHGNSPPWSESELKAKVRNAYQYGRNEVGAASPEADFGPIPADAADPFDTTPKPKPKRLHLVHLKDAEPDFSRQAIVKGTLSIGGMSVLYGDSNTGKTFFALDLALAVAQGQSWQGLRTTAGGVVYVAAEAGRSLLTRVAAYKKHHGLDECPFAIVPCPVDLRSTDSDTAELVELIKEAAESMGTDVVLVVVDTLSRALAGGNENASEDMGAFIGNVDRVRHATQAHLMIVHHTGKDKAKGARGHSSLRAAVDTEMEIDEGRTVTITKQRDYESGQQYGFELLRVDLGVDADGDAVTSCVATPCDVSKDSFESAMAACKGERSKNKRLALESLKLACERQGDEPNNPFCEVALDDWRTEFFAKIAENDPDLLDTRAKSEREVAQYRYKLFKRQVSSIVSNGWVLEVPDKECVLLNFR